MPAPLAFGETGVKNRIKNVLRYKKPGTWVNPACILIVSFTFLVLTGSSPLNKATAPAVLQTPPDHLLLIKNSDFENPTADIDGQSPVPVEVIPPVDSTQIEPGPAQSLLLRAALGVEVYSPVDGTVTEARRLTDSTKHPEYGQYVVIEDTDQREYRLFHLNRVDVEVGDQVWAGTAIGTVGQTGNIQGSALGVQVLQNGLLMKITIHNPSA